MSANGRYPFLNLNIWEAAVGILQADENEDADEDEDKKEEEEACLEGESEVEPQATPKGGAIVLDNVSIDT